MKKVFNDKRIKHSSILSPTNLRYALFIFVWLLRDGRHLTLKRALRMFLLEAAHVGNIDSTYFVSIQATSNESVSVLFAPRPRTVPLPAADGCMQR